MGRSQRHKIEEQGYTSRGEIYEQGAVNDQVLKAIGGTIGNIATARPVLSSISPTTAVCSSANLTLTATGTGFDANTKIIFGGKTMVTTYVSPTSITCPLVPAQHPLPKISTVTLLKGAALGSADYKSFTWTAS